MEALTLNTLITANRDSSAQSLVQPTVLVVLPSYNEGEAILTLLWELERTLSSHAAFQVLVVDDGSTDHSMAHVEQAGFSHVAVMRHSQNQGLGEAIRTGLTEALRLAQTDHDIIVVMDADCTHTPHLIDRMVAGIREGNDVVIASRYQYGARVVGLSADRLFFSHASSWLFRLLVPIPNVKDYTCGYRAYRAGQLREAFARYRDNFISETGFACMVDILIKLDRMGAIISEVPLILRYDRKVSTSKMKVLRTIVTSLGVLARNLFAGLRQR